MKKNEAGVDRRNQGRSRSRAAVAHRRWTTDSLGPRGARPACHRDLGLLPALPGLRPDLVSGPRVTGTTEGRAMRIVVIGGVAAGMSAASQAKRRRPDAEVVELERGRHVSYGGCGLPYNIEDPKRRIDDLVLISAERFRDERGIDVRSRHEALAIDTERRLVRARDLAFPRRASSRKQASGLPAWIPRSTRPARRRRSWRRRGCCGQPPRRPALHSCGRRAGTRQSPAAGRARPHTPWRCRSRHPGGRSVPARGARWCGPRNARPGRPRRQRSRWPSRERRG